MLSRSGPFFRSQQKKYDFIAEIKSAVWIFGEFDGMI